VVSASPAAPVALLRRGTTLLTASCPTPRHPGDPSGLIDQKHARCPEDQGQRRALMGLAGCRPGKLVLLTDPRFFGQQSLGPRATCGGPAQRPCRTVRSRQECSPAIRGANRNATASARFLNSKNLAISGESRDTWWWQYRRTAPPAGWRPTPASAASAGYRAPSTYGPPQPDLNRNGRVAWPGQGTGLQSTGAQGGARFVKAAIAGHAVPRPSGVSPSRDGPLAAESGG